jgi:hypothetical protein
MVTWLWLVIVAYAWSWRLCGITPATPNCKYTQGLSSEFHKAHSCSTKISNVRSGYVICFEYLRVTRLSRTFSYRQFSAKNVFVHFVVTLCVFVSLSLPVSILEIEHSTSDLKRWTKNLKCCERNKQCEKWKSLVFLWSEIRFLFGFTASWMEDMGVAIYF